MIDETTEQPEVIETPEIESDEGSVMDILNEGLKETSGDPKAVTQTEETKVEEQPETEPEESSEGEDTETLYAEVVLPSGDKLSFNTEEEYRSFIDAQPKGSPLRDGVLRQDDYTRKTSGS